MFIVLLHTGTQTAPLLKWLQHGIVRDILFWLHKRRKAKLSTFVPPILYITWLINQQMARV